MDERSFLAGLREIQAIDVLQLVQKSWEVDSVFVKGTNKFKLDAVKQHKSSKLHQYY